MPERSRAILLILFSFALLSHASVGRAEDPVRGPHRIALCAGLLTAPSFTTLGTRFPAVDEPPIVALPPNQPRRMYGRQIESAEHITAYLREALTLAAGLDRATTDASRPPKYWTRARKGALALNALAPMFIVAGSVHSIDLLLRYDMPPVVWAAAALVEGGAGYLGRDLFAGTWALLRCGWSPRCRAEVISHDPEWSTELTRYLARVGRTGAWPSIQLKTVGWPTSEAVARLMVDPPAADASPVEIENFESLLVRELTAARRSDANDRLIEVLLMFTRDPQSGRPFLHVGTQIKSPEVTRPPRSGPRGGRRIDPERAIDFVPVPAG